MKDSLKIVRFYINRIIRSKLKVIYLLISALLIIFASVMYKEIMVLNNTSCSISVTDSENYNEQAKYYKALYEYSSGITSELPEGIILPYNYRDLADEYHYKYLEYNYYYETSSKACQYVNLGSLFSNGNSLESGVFLVSVSNIAYYLIIMLSIIISLTTFFSDKKNGFEKNLLQTDINKKSLFIGRLTFCVFSISILISFITIVGLLIVRNDPITYSLLIDISTSTVEKVNIKTYFISKIVSNMFIALAVSGITVYIRTKIMNSYQAGLICMVVIFVVFVVYYLLILVLNTDPFNSNILSYFILINSQATIFGFKYFSYYLLLIGHVLVACIFYYSALKQIQVNNIKK